MQGTNKTKSKKEIVDLVAQSTSKKIVELESELKRLKSKYEGRYDHIKTKILSVTKDRNEMSLVDLSRQVDVTVNELEGAIQELKDEGKEIRIKSGFVERKMVPPAGQHVTLFNRVTKGGWVKFGVLGDTHLGNKHSRVDVLNTAYDHYESEGIEVVYHIGNMIDGFHPNINAFELLPEAGPSFERQVAFARDVYPKKKGITTNFLTGECHEGWWIKKTGWNIGRTMEDRFRCPLNCWTPGQPVPTCEHAQPGWCPVHGRDDMVYIGHLEVDVELRTPDLKRGVRGPMARMVHPGGGSSYAVSYKTQKMVEVLQGGEKPNIIFVGHYHKYNVGYPREVYAVQIGCVEDQTNFMRKHNLAAHVGYLIAEVFIGRDGVPEQYRHQWVPFYDRGFYMKHETW